MTVLLELPQRLGGVLTVGGIECLLQMTHRMEVIHHLLCLGKDTVQIRPVVLGPVGELHQRELGMPGHDAIEFRAEHRLQRRLLRLRHPRHAHRREPLTLGIVEAQRRTADLTIPRRPLGAFAIGALARPHRLTLTVLHRRHHPVERDAHRHRLVRHLELRSQIRLEGLALRFPALTEPFR